MRAALIAFTRKSEPAVGIAHIHREKRCIFLCRVMSRLEHPRDVIKTT